MKVRSRKIKKNVQMLSTALVGIWIVFVGYATYNFSSIDYSELLIVISIGIIIYLIPILIKNFAYWIKEIIVKIDLGTHDDLCEHVKKPAKTNTKEVGVPLEQARSRNKKVLGIVAAIIVLIILAAVALRDTSKDSLLHTKKVPSARKQLSQKTSLSSFQTKKDDILEVSVSPEQKMALATPQESKPQTLVLRILIQKQLSDNYLATGKRHGKCRLAWKVISKNTSPFIRKILLPAYSTKTAGGRIKQSVIRIKPGSKLLFQTLRWI